MIGSADESAAHGCELLQVLGDEDRHRVLLQVLDESALAYVGVDGRLALGDGHLSGPVELEERALERWDAIRAEDERRGAVAQGGVSEEAVHFVERFFDWFSEVHDRVGFDGDDEHARVLRAFGEQPADAQDGAAAPAPGLVHADALHRGGQVECPGDGEVDAGHGGGAGGGDHHVRDGGQRTAPLERGVARGRDGDLGDDFVGDGDSR